MKRFFTLLVVLALFACESTNEPNMMVTGNIKGLKKGKLYFQKGLDTMLVTIDSLEIKGDGNFAFEHSIESPEVFYLYLDKEDNNEINDRIMFFGEPGNININTTWKSFDGNPKITGSKSHEKWEEFNDMISQFNIKELTLMQLISNSEVASDSIKIDSIQRLVSQNIVNRYRYTLNFGLNNGSSYITPYVMLTEGKEANPKYLDSVYTILAPEVVNSKYGKEFKKFLGK